MKHIERSVQINASAARVWDVLVAFERYPEWNPFVQSVSGVPVAGARLQVHVRPPGGRGMKFRPSVLEATPGRQLRWLGRLFIPGLFDGEHSFKINELGPTCCELIQAETFRGLLAWLFGRGLDATGEGFEQMNNAIKLRAERGAETAA